MYLVLELIRTGSDEGIIDTVYTSKVAVFEDYNPAEQFVLKHPDKAYGIIDLDKGDISVTASLEI